MSTDIQKKIIPREEFLHKKAETLFTALSMYNDEEVFDSLSQLLQGLTVQENGHITCPATDIPQEKLLCIWMVAHTCSDIKCMNLSSMALSSLPPNFSNLQNLEELNLSYNRFGTIPSAVYELPSLKHISLNGNPLRLDSREFKNDIHLDIRDIHVEVLPSSVTSLHLYGSQFEALLPHIEQSTITNICIEDYQDVSEYEGTLSSITHFEVNNALIKSLPSLLNQCPNIEYLSWKNGHLVQWPDNLHLPKLTRLSLQNNRIAWLSGNLRRHTKLHTLDLSHNSLRFIPQSVRSCTQLKTLIMASCQLKKIDTSLSNMTELRILDVSGNPLISITPTLATMDLEKIDIRNTNINNAQALTAFVHGYDFEQKELVSPLVINTPSLERALTVHNLIRFIDTTTTIDELDMSEQIFTSTEDFVHIMKQCTPKTLRFWKTTIPSAIPEDCPRPEIIFAETKDFHTFPESWHHLLVPPKTFSVHIESRFRESTFRTLLLQIHPEIFVHSYDVPTHISLPHGKEQQYLDLFAEHDILLTEIPTL